MPRKIFVAGEILTAADLQANAVDQSVMVFDDAAARTTAIPSPVEGMVTYLKDVDRLEKFTTVFEAVNTGFTASTTFTVSNATQGDFVHTTGSTFTVPSLGAPIVKVTVIGGGGGGGAARDNNGATGGTTTFNAGGAGSVSAGGGGGGRNGSTNVSAPAGSAGFSAGNGGGSGGDTGQRNGGSGGGGEITVAYLNLSGISTVDVTIGAGGAGGAAGGVAGQAGGRGEVIVEYVAA